MLLRNFFFLRPTSFVFPDLIFRLFYFSELVFFAQYWANVRLTVHIKKSDYEKYYGQEHGYLIMNHTYEIDWLAGWILCDNVRILGVSVTFVDKSSIPRKWRWISSLILWKFNVQKEVQKYKVKMYNKVYPFSILLCLSYSYGDGAICIYSTYKFLFPEL